MPVKTVTKHSSLCSQRRGHGRFEGGSNPLPLASRVIREIFANPMKNFSSTPTRPNYIQSSLVGSSKLSKTVQ